MLNSKVDIYQGNAGATIKQMVDELKTKGYNIEEKTTGGNAISDIVVSPTMKMGANSNATIEVTLVPNENSAKDYYAVEGGKYYKMHYGTDRVTIDRTETDVSGAGSGGSGSLTAEIKTGSTGTGISVGSVNTNDNTIPLTSTQDATGTTTILVKYGSITKECNVTIGIIPTYTQGNERTVSIITNFGKIDVIWLKGTGITAADVTSTPNSPKDHLAGMTPVKFDTDGTIIQTTTSDTNWYSYNAGGAATTSGLPDNTTSNWANAKNSDDSLFVWIPRFAYRITYYNTTTPTGITTTATPTGYYDGYGMWDAYSGKIKYQLESTIKTVEYNGDKYIIHPAFCNGATDGYNEGQWSSALEGFWVAKYQMSKETKSNDTWNAISTTSASNGNAQVGDEIRAVSKAGKPIWRYSTIGNCFYNALHYSENDGNTINNSTADSHLMKNSEWGAIAYLTHSQYGRNGTETAINNSEYTSGAGGVLSSTTGNYYGIYDLSGAANEYVAAFNDIDSKSYYSSNGWTGLTTSSNSNNLATKYSNKSSTFYGKEIYKVGKTGDSTKEVYRGDGDRGWAQDHAYFMSDSYPFLTRGGGSREDITAGVFCYSRTGGPAEQWYSFRVVLAP